MRIRLVALWFPPVRAISPALTCSMLVACVYMGQHAAHGKIIVGAICALASRTSVRLLPVPPAFELPLPFHFARPLEAVSVLQGCSPIPCICATPLRRSAAVAGASYALLRIPYTHFARAPVLLADHGLLPCTQPPYFLTSRALLLLSSALLALLFL